jgi:hypothetical protein
MFKYLVKNGDSMHVARLLLNSTSVTGYDSGNFLAVSKCAQIKTYYFYKKTLWDDKIPLCTNTIPIKYFSDTEWHLGYYQISTKNILLRDTSFSCSTTSFTKHFHSLDGNILKWNGSDILFIDSTFKYIRLTAAEIIPNITHLHLMANLIAHPIEEDFDIMTDLIQNTSMNILKILSISSTNGNVLFDSHTLTDAAIQSVNLMKEVAENVLTTIFPLHKIVTILIFVITAIIITLIVILIIRYLLRRKKRTVGKRALTHLKSIMDTNDDYITVEEAQVFKQRPPMRHADTLV